MADFVLDTSAIMAHLRGERGGETVRQLLAAANNDATSRIFLPFISMMEVEHLLLRHEGRVRAEQVVSVLRAWPVEIIESNENWRHEAARVKASAQVSTVAAWIASLALVRDAQLVHKDPEFDLISGLKVLKLPYKK